MGSVWLGFCVRGVVVFDVHRNVKTATQHCAWRKTNNISYAVRNKNALCEAVHSFLYLQRRKFVIELQDHPEPLVFYTSSYRK